VILLAGAVGVLSLPAMAGAEKLPVFKLAPPRVDTARAAQILTRLSGKPLAARTKADDRRDAVVQRSGDKAVEVYKASGALFLRDTKQLWNPELKPRLPGRDEAKTLADRFLRENQLLPQENDRIKVSFTNLSESGVATDTPNASSQADKTILDIQANYGVSVAVQRGKEKAVVPVVGGGGDFKVAVGQDGAVIGYHGVWRPITGVAAEEEILSQKEAEERFRRSVGALKLTKLESYLAYYSAPAFEAQSVLPPVWVIRAEIQVGDQRVPIRSQIVAATRFGPESPKIRPQPRAAGQKPRPGSLDQDERRKPTRTSWLDTLGEIFAPRSAEAQDGTFEAGTSWIGPSQGLGGSPANAKGFVDGLAAAGWKVNFNWGELAAFESDWNSNDDNWVDAADFVFYTGHANSDGWVLNPPSDTFLHFSEVGSTPGSPNDLYGSNDLEWIIIAACGPHQSNHFVGGVGNAFDRWRGIFDGLHVFLGYGAITFDNTQEGARVTELARSGWPVIDAWFRTAWEIQPSTNGASAPDGPTIFVTAMYAHMGDHATRNDHIWGAGTTVDDPVGPNQQRQLMWSGT
jgi:hypothetical protein